MYDTIYGGGITRKLATLQIRINGRLTPSIVTELAITEPLGGSTKVSAPKHTQISSLYGISYRSTVTPYLTSNHDHPVARQADADKLALILLTFFKKRRCKCH